MTGFGFLAGFRLIDCEERGRRFLDLNGRQRTAAPPSLLESQGQHKDWDLANFYWSETRSHLHWAVRIIPVRKDNSGVEIKLVDILEAMENGPLKQLGESIAAKDSTAFEKSYRFSLETCYSCHKASDKPFIRLQIPTQPETPIINFDPAATWPR